MEVGSNFGNYASIPGWRLEPGWLENRPVLAFYRTATSPRPDYVLALTVHGAQVTSIRGYRYVPYLFQEVAADSYTPAFPSQF